MIRFGHIVISAEEQDNDNGLVVQLSYSGESDFTQENSKLLFNLLLNKIDLAIQETFRINEEDNS